MNEAGSGVECHLFGFSSYFDYRAMIRWHHDPRKDSQMPENVTMEMMVNRGGIQPSSSEELQSQYRNLMMYNLINSYFYEQKIGKK